MFGIDDRLGMVGIHCMELLYKDFSLYSTWSKNIQKKRTVHLFFYASCQANQYPFSVQPNFYLRCVEKVTTWPGRDVKDRALPMEKKIEII